MDHQDEVPGGMLSELRRLNRACSNFLDLLEEAETLQRTLEISSALAKAADDLRDAAIVVRDQSVTGIWKAEELSLAQLAKRVGISKARADQITREQVGRPSYRRSNLPKESPDV